MRAAEGVPATNCPSHCCSPSMIRKTWGESISRGSVPRASSQTHWARKPSRRNPASTWGRPKRSRVKNLPIDKFIHEETASVLPCPGTNRETSIMDEVKHEEMADAKVVLPQAVPPSDLELVIQPPRPGQ